MNHKEVLVASAPDVLLVRVLCTGERLNDRQHSPRFVFHVFFGTSSCIPSSPPHI